MVLIIFEENGNLDTIAVYMYLYIAIVHLN